MGRSLADPPLPKQKEMREKPKIFSQYAFYRMFIPDPRSGFLHPGSRIKGPKRHRITDPDPQTKYISIFNPKIFTELSEI
jgi:hypothetical protein